MAILSICNSLERLPSEEKRLWYVPVCYTDFPDFSEGQNTFQLIPALKNVTASANSRRKLQFLTLKGSFKSPFISFDSMFFTLCFNMKYLTKEEAEVRGIGEEDKQVEEQVHTSG